MNTIATTARVVRNLHRDETLPLDMLEQLKRTTFLLASARLVITDQVGRQTATTAVRNAMAVIARAEA